MNSRISDRVLEETEEILNTGNTVRQLAKKFHLSKSTIHKDLHERLFYINKEKYDLVAKILKYHQEVRHIRGGESTKQKYLKLR